MNEPLLRKNLNDNTGGGNFVYYNTTLLDKEIFHPERFRGNEGFALADITVS